MAKMDELLKLEHLSLVSKICTELDNHLGMNDKDLAEFIIDLAETHTKLDDFKKALIENGAEFPDSFIANLLRIIQLMKTSKNSKLTEDEFKAKVHSDELASKFPGLAIPNEPIKAKDVAKDEKDVKDLKVKKDKMHSVADDMMAELEAFAPSQPITDGGDGSGGSGGAAPAADHEDDSKKVEKRDRSRERKSRRDRSKERTKDEKSSRRSRSRDKRHRSRYE